MSKMRRRQEKEAAFAYARKLVLDEWASFCTDVDTLVLYILWTEFGFGKVRLERFFDKLQNEHADLVRRFSCGDREHYAVMRKRLKDGTGVDPVELLARYEEDNNGAG